MRLASVLTPDTRQLLYTCPVPHVVPTTTKSACVLAMSMPHCQLDTSMPCMSACAVAGSSIMHTAAASAVPLASRRFHHGLSLFLTNFSPFSEVNIVLWPTVVGQDCRGAIGADWMSSLRAVPCPLPPRLW